MKYLVRLMLCFMISFSLVEIPMMKAAHAGMITTGSAVEEMNRAQNHQKVVDFMSRSDVKDQLVKLGVSPEEATKRVASMSDAEMQKASADIDSAIAGGDIGGILVLVLVILLIIYLAKRI